MRWAARWVRPLTQHLPPAPVRLARQLLLPPPRRQPSPARRSRRSSLGPIGLSDEIAIASCALALVAVVIAIYAIRRGNKNSSVATLVTLNDGYRQAWQRFLAAKGDQREYEFSELMNLLEVGCAIDAEKSLVGVSREIAREYLTHALQLLDAHEEARRLTMAASHDPTTFKYVRRFRASWHYRRAGRTSLANPQPCRCCNGRTDG